MNAHEQSQSSRTHERVASVVVKGFFGCAKGVLQQYQKGLLKVWFCNQALIAM